MSSAAKDKHPSGYSHPPPDNRDRRTVPKVKSTAASKGNKKLQPRPISAHGNYPNYYGKRAVRSRVDARLRFIDKTWIMGKKVLDVGCNAGLVTLGIASLFQPKFVEGVDIDPALVRKARAALAMRGSLVEPEAADEGHPEDRMDVDGDVTAPQRRKILDYFPVSCTHLFGPLPVIDISQDATWVDTRLPAPPPPPFPQNIRFRCGDWLHEPNPSTVHFKYDVIIAFSITKWIHINHGDAGVKKFFNRCYHSLNPGGCLLLEPQGKETYRKSTVTFTNAMDQNVRNITLQPEDFPRYLLEEVRFSSVDYLGTPENHAKGFQRPIYRCVK
ncbi:Bicoid-interacting protein 3-domain-containing protein [Powellomyces hirtus]|nr:Bicoid-interacting protein 3-domain-containing protein [Powellomyces hirtus]